MFESREKVQSSPHYAYQAHRCLTAPSIPLSSELDEEVGFPPQSHSPMQFFFSAAQRRGPEDPSGSMDSDAGCGYFPDLRYLVQQGSPADHGHHSLSMHVSGGFLADPLQVSQARDLSPPKTLSPKVVSNRAAEL